jgi:hypothetical protein
MSYSQFRPAIPEYIMGKVQCHRINPPGIIPMKTGGNPGIIGNRRIELLSMLRIFGDDRSRRERLAPDCEPRGADIVKSAQKISANRTNYAALPLAA